MASVKHRQRPGLQIQIEDIETEADRQLQTLLKRQLDTAGTLDDHLARKKAFTESSYYKPLDEEVSGARSLEEFVKEEKQNEQLEELRQCGLTEQQIQLYLNADKEEKAGAVGLCSRINPSHTSQLEAIQRKIDSRKEALSKPVKFAAVKFMTRHEMELEQAITHGQAKHRMLSNLTEEKKLYNPSWVDSNHPINHLDSILQQAIHKRRKDEGEAEVATCAPRPDNYQSCGYKDEVGSTTGVAGVSMAGTTHSMDVGPDGLLASCESVCAADSLRKGPDIPCSDPSSPETHCQDKLSAVNTSCVLSKSVSDSHESRPVLHANIQPVPKEIILKYKLTLEDIKKIDRFKNYDPGSPNKKLFIKNLTSHVTEGDLVSLFHRFQQKDGPKIVYQLMQGRMKGQAFVTFDSVSTAKEALKLVNGYHFKGKPIIIQYGKTKE